MKKSIIILIAILVIPMTGLVAQEGAFTFLSFDIGQGSSIVVDTGAYNTDAMFGINFRVAGPMTVGFTNYSANVLGAAVSMLKVKFDMGPQIRAVLGYGTGTRTVLGFEFVPFRRGVGGLFTEFKLAPEYVFTPTTVSTGRLVFPLLLGIGF